MKMQAQDIYKRCCLAAVAATFFCTARGAVYEDSLVSVDKGTVVRHLTDKGIVYVFTATNATEVTLKQAATLDAALVVGGGGSGGSKHGGGHGGRHTGATGGAGEKFVGTVPLWLISVPVGGSCLSRRVVV